MTATAYYGLHQTENVYHGEVSLLREREQDTSNFMPKLLTQVEIVSMGENATVKNMGATL